MSDAKSETVDARVLRMEKELQELRDSIKGTKPKEEWWFAPLLLLICIFCIFVLLPGPNPSPGWRVR